MMRTGLKASMIVQALLAAGTLPRLTAGGERFRPQHDIRTTPAASVKMDKAAKKRQRKAEQRLKLLKASEK